MRLPKMNRSKPLRMGTEHPKSQKANAKTKAPFLPLLALAVICFISFLVITKVAFSGENEAPKLSPKEEAKLQKRLKEIDEAEQYALIANTAGLYPCNHPGRTSCQLLPGEIWKYGTTTKGQFGRYSLQYLEDLNVFYIVQFEGTISECLKEEQRKLFYYPYLPENLARADKDRLPRPPYNSKMQ